MKRCKVLLVAIFALCLSVPSFLSAQLDTVWTRIYNGPANSSDFAYAVATDANNNVYVTGVSVGSGTGDDYATIKYNSMGVQQWVKRYSGPGSASDYAYAIAVDNAGNIYVTGYSTGSTTFKDYATIKYYPNGDTAWVRRYNGPGNGHDEANAIAVDASGNVYVTGYSYRSNTLQSGDYATIKYSTDGVQQWVARYNGPSDSSDIAKAIAIDNAGNVYVTGSSTGIGTGYDYTTVKYNSSGVQQWERRYSGTTSNVPDDPRAIVVDNVNNVCVTGMSYGAGAYDVATIRYSPSDSVLWVKRYTSPLSYTDGAQAIGVDGFNNVYVAGACAEINYGFSDYLTIKYSAIGDELWTRKYDGPTHRGDGITAMKVNSAGDVFVTGESTSSTNTDICTIRYLANGDTAWIRRYNGLEATSADGARAIALDGAGGVYVTGHTSLLGPNWNYVTIKYEQSPTSVEDASTSVPDRYWLEQNYPNPFNPDTKIKYQITKTGRVTLTIYDVIGREVETLVDKTREPGAYAVIWNAEKSPSGIYFCRLQARSTDGLAREFVQTRKLVLLK